MAIPKFFKISKITRFIFWKFQMVVIEAHKIRCSMKLVRHHLDLNWQSYGNPKFLQNLKKTFFKILKFQLLVFLDYQIRCSMKLVRLHLDLNWESYGNPKFLQKFRKFLPPTENGCGPILWVVPGCNFVENFLSTINKITNCFFPPKMFFAKISQLRFANFEI